MLPPIRALAAELGVNRNTVAAAYRQLVAAGVAETHGRGGTAIASVPELQRDGSRLRAARSSTSRPGTPTRGCCPSCALPAVRPGPLRRHAPRIPGSSSGPPQRFARDVERTCTVVVAHGAVDAVERVLAAHLTRGDAVAVEDPCFLAHIGTLRLNGFEAVPGRRSTPPG